jgi:hypothetical protein
MTSPNAKNMPQSFRSREFDAKATTTTAATTPTTTIAATASKMSMDMGVFAIPIGWGSSAGRV